MAAAAVLAVGTALQLYGGHQASKAQRKAEAANAAMMREQKKLQEYASRRELDIFTSESDMAVGQLTNQLAKNGLTISGSALAKLAQTQSAISREKSAIKIGAAARGTIASMQIAQTEASIKAINRIANIQGLTTLVNAYGMYKGMSGSSSASYKMFSLLNSSGGGGSNGRVYPQYNGDTNTGLYTFQYDSPTFGGIGR